MAHGACHPMCCLAFWCEPLVLGQVATRMKLDGLGAPGQRSESWWSAFKVVAFAFIVYMGLDQTFSMLTDPYFEFDVDEDGNIVYPEDAVVPTWVLVLLAVRSLVRFAFFVYILVVMIRTRAHIRNRYNIPEQTCSGCEDCCCSFWLPCCTVTQMARHTADYDTYAAACCTETGLSPQVPAVV
jgi:Cys-rich protein (TIGR01571 family)